MGFCFFHVSLIFSCEIFAFSFLIGAFTGSSIFGLVVLGGSSLIMYAFFQRLYTALPLVWGATLLGGITTLLWASYIDAWFETTFIAVFLGLLSGVICYFANDRFFKKYQV